MFSNYLRSGVLVTSLFLGGLSFSPQTKDNEIKGPGSFGKIIDLSGDFWGLSSSQYLQEAPKIRYLYTYGYTDNLIYTYGAFIWNNYEYRYNGYEKKKESFYIDPENEESNVNASYETTIHDVYIFTYTSVGHFNKWSDCCVEEGNQISYSLSNSEGEGDSLENVISVGAGWKVLSASIEYIENKENNSTISNSISMEFTNYDSTQRYKNLIFDLEITQKLYMIYIDDGNGYSPSYYYTRRINSICTFLEE